MSLLTGKLTRIPATDSDFHVGQKVKVDPKYSSNANNGIGKISKLKMDGEIEVDFGASGKVVVPKGYYRAVDSACDSFTDADLDKSMSGYPNGETWRQYYARRDKVAQEVRAYVQRLFSAIKTANSHSVKKETWEKGAKELYTRWGIKRNGSGESDVPTVQELRNGRRDGKADLLAEAVKPLRDHYFDFEFGHFEKL